MRCFVALELPAEVKAALARLQEALRASGGAGARWVGPQGIHLTLKFLGEVAPERLPEIEEKLGAVARKAAPFSLEVRGLGLFPHTRRPRVAWVGIEGEVEQLIWLQRAVDLALAPLGFPPEPRAFTPHLTLARLREDSSLPEKQAFGQRFLEAHLEPLEPFRVEALHLMRSQLQPQGAIYSRLALLPLEGALVTPED